MLFSPKTIAKSTAPVIAAVWLKLHALVDQRYRANVSRFPLRVGMGTAFDGDPNVYGRDASLIRACLFRVLPIATSEIQGKAGPPMLYLNSKPIRREEVGDALTNELKLRPDWVVYVEADEQVSWSDVIGAMDIIRSRQARIVLLIRRREEKRPSR